MAKKPVVLIIRDGWGDNPGGEKEAKKNGDCPRLASTPFHDQLYKKYPVSHVSASGTDVGLPDGQMGNSEVGHLNLGAGRIVYQDLTRINKAVENGTLATNEILQEACAKAAVEGGRLHLLGLMSDGGVHSSQEHIIALAKVAKEAGVKDIMVHAFTDGRDTSPTGGKDYVAYCEDKLAEQGARIVTVIGRYYAMDRDKRWDRSKLAWDAIIHGVGEKKDILPSEAMAEQYEAEKTDEFILPMIFEAHEEQRVRDNDVVLFLNFRADRARQFSQAILDKSFSGHARGVVPDVHYVTLTEYDENYDCPVIFATEKLDNVLGKVVSDAGKNQLRIAETEKYPHVSFFFNGGVEEPYPNEDREMLQSPKDVQTYDQKPEMAAEEVCQTICSKIENYDLAILNFANPDMVGHTGSIKAACAAVEKIDETTRRVVEKVLELRGKLLITGDHGNCEQMLTADGKPHTAHTTNPVHLVYVADDADEYTLKDGILADLAPTLLDMMGAEQPAEMTGQTRLVKK